MEIKAVLFDLDGTLLPMDQDCFTKAYFKGLAAHLAPHGYDAQQLTNAIWEGTAAMIRNDGRASNDQVFWTTFAAIYGEQALTDMPHFEEYYRIGFQKVRSVCGFQSKSAVLVHMLQDAGIRVVLATNPLFPAIATESRIRWAGLTPEDFELYTTYENINYCKPNPAYYAEICQRLELPPAACLMVGNDVSDDMVAAQLGMHVFLLTDCLINNRNTDLSIYPQGNFEDLERYLFTHCTGCPGEDA